MKVRLTRLTAAAASLAALTFAGAGHVYAQGGGKATTVTTAKPSAAAATQDPDLQAIRDNTLTVKGMKFPKVSLPNAKSGGQSCCNIGDTRSHDVMWPNYETQGVKPKGKVTHERTEPYSPTMTCWVISAYRFTINSEAHSSSNLTGVPSNYSFVTSNQYQQTYEDLKNFVMNMNILNKYKIEILANLKDFTNNYAAYAHSVSASNGSVILYTKLESAGRTGGRSWIRGVVNTTETCCPPEIQDPVALKSALTTWVNNTVNALPNKGQGKGFNPRDIKSLSIEAAPRENIRANPEPSPAPR